MMMSRSPERGALALLTPESEQQIDALRRSLRRSRSFALHVVFADGQAKVEVNRRLRAWSGLGGIPELLFFPEGEGAARAIEEFLSRARLHVAPIPGAVLADGDAVFDEDGESAALVALNLSRDILGALIRGPLVLVFPASRGGDLARVAPDLFDTRAMSVELEAVLAEAPPPLALPAPARVWNEPARSKEELRREAARLRALAASSEPPPSGALADAWIRLGWAFLALGDPGEARGVAEESKLLAEAVGYTSAVATALMFEADVVARSGHLDASEQSLQKALKLSREAGDLYVEGNVLVRLARWNLVVGRLDGAYALLERALALFQKVGAVHERALTIGEVARVHSSRGELQEARRLLQTEVIPVLEMLGDARNRAAAVGMIADIHRLRGELQEALRLHVEEELPIYKELQAGRDQANTVERIARIHHEQGQVDGAIELLTREVLPVYEDLGATHDLVRSRALLASMYLARSKPGDQEQASELLHLAETAALRLGLPDAKQIRAIQEEHNLRLS